MHSLLAKINNYLKWSFYLIFFLVPLVMWPDTFELFEFNKMWFVFGMSLVILFLWGTKMIISKKFEIRRTPLDIPIALFLTSQVISTILSMDPHVSFWGYYSRFNGGLLSTIAYIFLYYAFATNFIHTGDDAENKPRTSYKLLVASLLSGLAVSLWGIPGHFGADPTCLVFRGSLDVACWTEQFQPTVRIFSTLGQPNWMGTFIASLIPIAIGFGMYNLSDWKKKLFVTGSLILTAIYYIALLFTGSQSSFLGLVAGLAFFVVIFAFKHKSEFKKAIVKSPTLRFFVITTLIIGVFTFLIGTPIKSLNKFATLEGIKSASQKADTSNPPAAPQRSEGLEGANNIVLGGSESGDIRLIVWQGAIELFKRNPLFGTGVETFAYAYYQVKPVSHNLTSEWDFLYNKAHNEYLNYLATTGAFGLLTYLSFLGLFLYYALHKLTRRDSEFFPISLGLVSGWVSLLVSNFFGFSVVIVNLFIFLFPIFFFDLERHKSLNKTFSFSKKASEIPEKLAPPAAIIIVILGLVVLYYEFFLFNFWSADRKYALGNNLNKSSEYVQAYTPLTEAVAMLPQEDLYKDELSINMATLSLLLAEQKQSSQASQFGQRARALSDEITNKHKNNVVFLKTRARVAFALSEVDPNGIRLAIETIERARLLAPTDAKLLYNEGLFYSQLGEHDKAINYIQEAIKLKPNYEDAYYSLAKEYQEIVKLGGNDAISARQKAIDALNTIITKINPNHAAARELLNSLQ